MPVVQQCQKFQLRVTGSTAYYAPLHCGESYVTLSLAHKWIREFATRNLVLPLLISSSYSLYLTKISYKMSSPNKQRFLQTEIPGGRDLYKLLGRNASEEESILASSIHEWRKTYVSSDGTLGKHLLFWSSPKAQEDLRSMAQSYLEFGGNASRYWPPGARSEAEGSMPKYPRDQEWYYRTSMIPVNGS